MTFDYANRVKKIPSYLFAEIEEKVRIKLSHGVDIIDFGIGDPDIPTPKLIVETASGAGRLARAVVRDISV